MDKPIRTFLGKALRDISEQYHADVISLDDFHTIVRDAIAGYYQNMQHLSKNLATHFSDYNHYMEEWMESFLAWFELEQRND